MSYEVELKFPVPDPTEPLRRLTELSAAPGETIEQRDTYFAHPQRSFAETNEALRVRQIGEENRITYKGPIIDRATKTRREIELGFEPGAASGDQLLSLLEILGFTRVRTVVKQRQTYHLDWRGRPCEICCDTVDGLGTFMEVETISEEEALEEAKQAVLDLAASLGLSGHEPRSYLKMLLERDGAIS